MSMACKWGHGDRSIYVGPDGYEVCRFCASDAAVLRRARRLLPKLPKLAAFREQYGQDAIHRLRAELCKSQRTDRKG